MEVKTNKLLSTQVRPVADQTTQDLKNAILIVSIGINVTVLITWLTFRLLGS